MQFSKSKTTATVIALFLVLTISASLALPIANAHTPAWQIRTNAYITVAPTPVGVDQTVNLIFWIDSPPPTAAGAEGGRWQNMKVDVTKPDGTTENLGSFTSDPVGGGWATYTPTQVGTYTFTFTFPEQVATLTGPSGLPGSPSNYVNDTYLSSTASTTLIVQEDPIPQPITTPLPSGYWTRPIEGQNTNWYTIASHWLGSPQIINRVQPDGTAPNSAHVMWNKPLSFGGVVGGTRTGLDGMTYYSGTAYEGKFSGILIMNGRLYHALPRSDVPTGNGYNCVDLLTGETIWWQNYTSNPSFGQLYDYESGNQHGVVPNGYLWTTSGGGGFFGPSGQANWTAYDPIHGNWVFTLTDVPAGTNVYGANGEILVYTVNAVTKTIGIWNNTAAPGLLAGTSGSNAWQWRPVGKTVNASTAYTWTASAPALPTGASVVKVIHDDLLLGSNGTMPGIGNSNPFTMWAISLKPNSRGSLLWMKNYDAPAGNLTRSIRQVDSETRTFTMYDKETMQYTGYSIDTGEYKWGPTASEAPLNFYALTTGAFGSGASSVAYGKLYSTGYSGILYCYDLTNGKLLWNYSAPSGFADPTGAYSLLMSAIADGKVYLYSYEHSANAPHWKESKMRCVNATTGEEVWTLDGWGADGGAIADGYWVYLNLYDMQIYCIGKGPSATTVTASPKVSVHGSSVLVEGTVTDQCAGAKALAEKMGYVNGVAAVNDASMDEWMAYLYMQKSFPSTATGVEVTLDALDPNGNFVHIGTPTSDTSGTFSYMFTPEVPGKYTIIATFAGSESYGSSYAETAIGVEEAPAATAAPEYPQPIDYTWTIIGTAVVLLVAIAIVGLLVLRRK